MVALTSAPFVALFACSWIFVLCQGTQELKETVKPGEDATLQCRGHRGADIEVIKWNRPDLKSDDIYVFFFRDNCSYENNTHESYRGRVKLRDPEMKDGDASVILKNVNINDTGTYQCRVREKKEKGKAELISIIMLTVTEPGHTAGHKEGGDKEGGDKEGGNKEEGDKERNVGLRVALPVCVIVLVVVVVVVVVVIFKKYIRPTGNQQPAINRHELQNLQRD
ncbi:coxsackievirus and adenovirus receptor homolog isoform X1 [Micropterus salmoides]|uniref:coxsackievirus and adenovirus receptor homolog isoform X1 n=1 Tax=Micropterus salmoides TaxID=27706 RepID=UPI0018ECF054|nr:coxsackievirus and adenovirus receptor homolog isoform X1 [Micropterus salmoides]